MIYQKTFTVHTKIILNWMASFLPPNFHLKFPKLFYDQVLFATLLLKKKEKEKNFYLQPSPAKAVDTLNLSLEKNISIFIYLFLIKKKKHIYLHLFFLTFKPMCQLWSISCEWNLIIGIGFLSGFWVIVRGRVGHLMFIW